MVLALLLGGIGGLAYSDRRSGWTATEVLQVNEVANAAALLGIGVVDETDVRRLAIQAREDYANDELSASVGISTRAQPAGDVVEVTARGTSSESVLGALDLFRQFLTSNALEPRLTEIDGALRASENLRQDQQATLDDIDAELAGLDPDDPIRDILIVERVSAHNSLNSIDGRIDSLEEYRTFVSESLIESISLETEEPGSTWTGAFVGVVFGAFLVAAGFGLFALFDHRVRRRLQIERVAPGVRVLGLLPRGGGQHAYAVARAVDRFVKDSGSTAAVLVGVGGDPGERDVAELLAGHITGIDLRSADGSIATALQQEDAAPILVVRSGASQEDDVAATAASLEAGGDAPVAAILVDVPPSEFAWASLGSVHRDGPRSESEAALAP